MECHRAEEAVVEFLLPQIIKNKGIEILCLTGTPKKSRGLFYNLQSIAPISYVKQMDDAIDEEFTNDYKIHVLYHSLNNVDKDIEVKYGEKSWFQTEWQRYCYLKESYDKIIVKRGFPYQLMMLKLFFKQLRTKEKIAKLLLASSLADKKVLIYAGCIEQAETFGLPMYHSKLKKGKQGEKGQREINFEAFLEDEIQYLVDVNGIKESVNIPNLTHVLMLAPDASEIGFRQSLGRILRLTIGNIANFVVLCTENTIEHQWLKKALASIPEEKITHTNINNLKLHDITTN